MINGIPVVPVGLVSKLSIPADRSEVLWIEDIWQEAFKILRKTKPTYTRPPRQEQDKSKTRKTKTINRDFNQFDLVMY